MTRKIKIILFLFLALCSWVSSAEEHIFLTVEQRTEDIDKFCQFVAENYAYFDIKRTDWPRACTSYSAQLADVKDRSSYIRLLERALRELYDFHAHLGTNTKSSPRMVPSGSELIGSWIEDKAIISDVRSVSNAEQAGLRPGMEVLAINGVPIDSAVKAIKPQFLSTDDPAARDWALQVVLAGCHDQLPLHFRIKSENEIKEFEFVSSDSKPSSLLSYRVMQTVGYVRIHNSLGQQKLVEEFDSALLELQNVRALIIDLRDTPSGGTSSVARGILGRLVSKPSPYQRHELVSEFRQTGIQRIWTEYVAPRGKIFDRPVIVLVGGWTGSMGEGLAIGLNATLKAPVFGKPMAHLLGALGEMELPNSKITVRIPTEKLYHVDGTPREKFLPCIVPTTGESKPGSDTELEYVFKLASKLGAAKAKQPTHWSCNGVRQLWAPSIKH